MNGAGSMGFFRSSMKAESAGFEFPRPADSTNAHFASVYSVEMSMVISSPTAPGYDSMP